MKIVVTSGGTDVPIDAVRCISNSSAGTTGALIAEAALKHGHFVHYLCARNSRAPFQKELTGEYTQRMEVELSRVIEATRRVVPPIEELSYRSDF
jgi:phosphopantothenoylcysteine synthetase/decarboxylase